MRRTISTAASLACVVGLVAACGGGSSEPLTQDQVTKALLTDEEFPLDGLTRGQEETGKPTKDSDSDSSTGDMDDMLEGSDASDECKEAFKAVDEIDGSDEVEAAASVEYSAENADNPTAAKSVQTMVQVWDGADDALNRMEELPDKCGTLNIKDDASGMEMTWSFSELDLPDADDARGVKMKMAVMGQEVDMTMASLLDGDNLTMVLSTGVSDEDTSKVLNKQFDKMQEAGE